MDKRASDPTSYTLQSVQVGRKLATTDTEINGTSRNRVRVATSAAPRATLEANRPLSEIGSRRNIPPKCHFLEIGRPDYCAQTTAAILRTARGHSQDRARFTVATLACE